MKFDVAVEPKENVAVEVDMERARASGFFGDSLLGSAMCSGRVTDERWGVSREHAGMAFFEEFGGSGKMEPS